MSFRTRLALVAAAAVGIAVVAASVVVYLVVHDQLLSEVDRTLQTRAGELRVGPPLHIDDGTLRIEGPAFGVENTFVQAVPAHGRAIPQQGYDVALPASGRDRETASTGVGRSYYSTKEAHGAKFRVFTVPATDQTGQTYALQIFRPLAAVDRTLHRITVLLVFVALQMRSRPSR